MKRRLVLAVAALALPASARAADAVGIEGRWSISLQGGTDLEAAGEYQGSGQGAVLGLTTTVEAQSHKEVYGRSLRGSLSVGYGVTRSIEIFGRGGHYAANAGQIQVGTAATLALLADFGKYEEWGGEAGVRYYFNPARPLKPYVAGVAGVRFLGAAPVTLSVPEANVFLADLAFYDKSTVGVFGADLGVSHDFSRNVGVGAEVGLRYQTKPSGIDTSLAGTGLETINDVGSRWSIPILGQITLRF